MNPVLPYQERSARSVLWKEKIRCRAWQLFSVSGLRSRPQCGRSAHGHGNLPHLAEVERALQEAAGAAGVSPCAIRASASRSKAYFEIGKR
jgi:hypothetical protein